MRFFCFQAPNNVAFQGFQGAVSWVPAFQNPMVPMCFVQKVLRFLDPAFQGRTLVYFHGPVCFHGSMFLASCVSKVLCLQGPLFPESVIYTFIHTQIVRVQ